MFTLILFGLFHHACDLSRIGHFESSNIILKTMPSNNPIYSFYRSANEFALNNKSEAAKWLEVMNSSFDTLPSRYRNTADMMLGELEQWKKNDLKDIGRDMRISSDKLKSVRAGQPTQQVQQEILDKLDKLIEEKEGKASASASPNGKDKGIIQSHKPANTSEITAESGKGLVDEKKLRYYAQNWGKMPPAERAKAIQETTRDLPPKYKPMVEEYFKSLTRLYNK